MKCRYFCRLPLDISPVYLTRGISPDLRLFYTARRILKEKLDRKPITLAAWKQEYDRLQAEYAKLSPQYKPLREDLMKMRRVQYCVDRVLQRRQPEQEAPKKKQDIEL